MIKILRFSRESSLFVLLQSIVRSISLIEAKRVYSCNNFWSLQVLISHKYTNKKIKKIIKKEKCYVYFYTLFSKT